MTRHAYNRPMAQIIGAAGSVSLAAALAFASGALAQDKKAAPQTKDAPAAAATAAAATPAAPGGEPVMWVKLCEKTPVISKKDGKDVTESKNICLTHHERLDGDRGSVIISAAVRQIEGQDKQHLMIMVPLGMALQPGIRATVYNKEQWEKAQKSEKVEDLTLKPEQLKFTMCQLTGCTAEIELTKEFMDKLKANPGLMILTINGEGRIVAFPVPLNGFTQALDGKPVDNAVYKKERTDLMKALWERSRQQQEGAGQPAAPGSPAPATPPAAAPAAPAAKK